MSDTLRERCEKLAQKWEGYAKAEAFVPHGFEAQSRKTFGAAAVYDSTIEEDKKFAKATPTGSIEMQVDNPAALSRFELGKYYYVDFTPIE